MEGDGKDQYTNSMATAIWAIDFTLECALLGFYDIHFDGRINKDNKQGFLNEGFEPQALYYAMIFNSLMMSGSPSIILPDVKAGTSSKIKIWGLKTIDKLSFVILNKDTNPDLNGTIEIVAKSNSV